jgi:hypothetical protein
VSVTFKRQIVDRTRMFNTIKGGIVNLSGKNIRMCVGADVVDL